MSRPNDLEITTRHPDFPLYAALEKQRYWLNGDPVLSHLFNALQATFPEGERFFIDSARDVRDQLPADSLPAALAKDIKAFIHQEAWHGKAHDEWVQALVALGFKLTEAAKLIASADAPPDASSEDLIRLALKIAGGGQR